jgi:hypothetical protein
MKTAADHLCKHCGRTFSDATLTHEYRQRRRDINALLYSMLSSHSTMRRAAFSLKVSLATVQRRLPYLAKVSDDYHAKMLHKMDPIKRIVFDDIQWHQHLLLLPEWLHLCSP